MKRDVTIDQICKGLRILEKYCPNASVMGNTAIRAAIELQEMEFKNITEEDRNFLLSIGWKTNGFYLWYI